MRTNKIDVKRAIGSDREGKVTFVKFFDKELYYKTAFDEEFTVPLEDTKGATFLAEDKAMYFMRWMQKWNKDLG